MLRQRNHASGLWLSAAERLVQAAALPGARTLSARITRETQARGVSSGNLNVTVTGTTRIAITQDSTANAGRSHRNSDDQLALRAHGRRRLQLRLFGGCRFCSPKLQIRFGGWEPEVESGVVVVIPELTWMANTGQREGRDGLGIIICLGSPFYCDSGLGCGRCRRFCWRRSGF